LNEAIGDLPAPQRLNAKGATYVTVTMVTPMKLLFDLDGTLTDSFQGIARCIAYAIGMLGRTPPPHERLKWCVGPPLKNSLAKLLASDDSKLVEAALAFYRERFGAIGLYENEVYEDIPVTLEALLQMGHTLYVATAKPAVYAEQIIDHFNLRRYFKGVYGSGLDGTRSEKTALISHILQNESLDASETFMIGDREHDIIGAKANAVCGWGVLWGYGTRQELEASGAQACFSHPRELVAVLQS
jgi:phosphoglycolate phosphatase